jgi:hypothetical protein
MLPLTLQLVILRKGCQLAISYKIQPIHINLPKFPFILISGLNPPEKYESQIGSPTIGENKKNHVPYHQPVVVNHHSPAKYDTN